MDAEQLAPRASDLLAFAVVRVAEPVHPVRRSEPMAPVPVIQRVWEALLPGMADAERAALPEPEPQAS